MSLIGMVDAAIRRDFWKALRNDPERRAAIREAAQAVGDAQSSDEEYAAIVRLREAFPR